MKNIVDVHQTIQNFADSIGHVVTIKGCLLRRRSGNSTLPFLIVRAGTGFTQVVVHRKNVSSSKFDEMSSLAPETSLEITGRVNEEPRAIGGYELTASDFTVYGESLDYPITPKEHGIDWLMDRRHVWIRSERQSAILRVRHTIINAVRDFLNDKGFVLTDAPILVTSRNTEDAFKTPYFETQEAELATSGQLYNEAAAIAVGRAYSFGPVFKMTRSRTRRHLMESWAAEPEMASADLSDAISLASELVSRVVYEVVDPMSVHSSVYSCLKDLKTLERDTEKLERIYCCHPETFPTMTHEGAVDTLKQKGLPVEAGMQFSGTAETVLSTSYDLPLVVTHYPTDLRPFNINHDPTDSTKALSFELFAPEGFGPIISGGQRIDDLGLLQRRMEERGIPVEQINWYLDLCRYGSVPRSGFTGNIEALGMWICGL